MKKLKMTNGFNNVTDIEFASKNSESGDGRDREKTYFLAQISEFKN